MSYSYYLIHGLSLKAFFFVFGKLFPTGVSDLWLPVLAVVSFFATLPASLILFLAVERPLSLAPSSSGSRP